MNSPTVTAERTVPEIGSPPAAPRSARLVLILGALTAITPLSIDMYLPALPEIARQFGASASQVQLTLSAVLLGLALGQMIAGPLSDTLGRRRPLLVGVAGYAVASLLCAVAPSVGALVVLRFAQGLTGAAGVVISTAIVRDLHSGAAAARFFSLLILVTGLAPILAPLIGGQLLRVTSWRGIFVTLAGIGALLLLFAATSLRETLPADRRQRGGLHVTLATFRRLLADRSFVRYALTSGLAFAALFAYISGSSFVLQDIYGVSPQRFSILFGLNALGLIAGSQVNGLLVDRVPPRRLLVAGLVAMAIAATALLAAVAVGVGLAGILPALFVVVAAMGFVMPNTTMLALAGHPDSAGSAAALLGVLRFAIGAAAAPLAGLGGSTTALPMAVVIAVCGVGALVVYGLLGRGVADADSQKG